MREFPNLDNQMARSGETSLVFVLNDCDDDLVEDIVEFVNDGIGLAVMVEEQSVKSKLFL